MLQQARSNARVFRGNRIDPFEDIQRAQRNVGEISNRSGDYI